MTLQDRIRACFGRPECSRCGLWREGCKHPMMAGRGASSPEILLIGEAPGELEDEKDEPFVGPSGHLLGVALQACGIPQSVCRFTNVVRCRPPRNKLTREKTRIACCLPLLQEEIAAIQPRPRIIVPLGAHACSAVLGSGSIRKLNGRLIEQDGFLIVPIYHPSAVFYSPTLQPVFEDAFLALKRAYYYGKAEPEPVRTSWTRSLAEVQRLFRAVHTRGRTSFDYESNFLQPWERPDPVVGTVALSLGTHEAVCVPLAHRDGPAWTADERATILRELRELLAAPGVLRIAHNAKYERIASRLVLGIYPGRILDTLLWHVHLDEEAPHDLDTLSWRYSDLGGYKDRFDEVLGDGENYLEAPLDALSEYNCRDVLVPERLVDLWMAPGVLSVEQRAILGDVQEPLVDVLASMEIVGKAVRPEAAQALADAYLDEAAKIEVELRSWPEVAAAEAILAGRKADTARKKIREGVLELEAVRQRLASEVGEAEADDSGLDEETRRARRRARAELRRKERMIERRKDQAETLSSADFDQQLNFRSDDQLRVLLLHPGAMGLPDTGYMTDGGLPSVGKDALLAWAVAYPRTRELRRYRRILHNWSQFLRPVPALIDNQDGRIHASYQQHRARTGRLASSGPNEQNRPRDDTCKELGVPPIQSGLYCSRFDGGVLVKGDYSQLELKLLASMSRDRAMVECYSRGWDLHARTTLGYADLGVGAFAGLVAAGATAAGVVLLPSVKLDFGQQVELAGKGPRWKWCRTQGKRVNFLSAYQGGPSALQAVLAEAGVYLSLEECSELVNGWDRIYPGVRLYMDDVVTRARYADGQAVAPDGRVRHLPALIHGNEEEQGHAAREAGNFGIQWLAAKLTMVALLLLDETLRLLDARTLIVGSVHDSIILDAPADEAVVAGELLRISMEQAALDPRWAPPGLLHPQIPITADVD